MNIDEIPSEARLPTRYGDFNIRVFHESETGLDHVVIYGRYGWTRPCTDACPF